MYMDKADENILSTLDKDAQIAYLLDINSSLEQQNEALTNDFAALGKSQAVLARENDELIGHNAELSKDVVSLKRENDHLAAEFDKLIEQIKIMNARAYGAKSERILPHQISLFNDMEAVSDTIIAEPSAEEILPKVRKKKASIDYSKFDTVVIEHTIPESERICDVCDTAMEEMGVEVKRVIKLIPARLVVEQHHRHVYVCVPCSKANAEDGTTPVPIMKASMPNFPLEKSCASPSLLAHIIYQKYGLALPVYRISDDMANSVGLTLTRQTLGNWVIRSYERWLALVYARMKERILENDILHIDETTVLVLKEPKRKKSSKSYMWLFASAECDVPLYLFEYRPSRARSVITDFLGDWQGAIIADGYGAYDNLGDRICRTSCLVHIRRPFSGIVKSVGKDKLEEVPNVVSLEALYRIEEIFHIDNTFNDMDAATRKAARIEKLKPEMDAFYEWCIQKQDEAVPSMALHKALSYAINQWPKLENALTDGRLPLENNRAERAIRPFAVGRRNWLFSDTPRGAEASAGIYSIITTAKGNGLKPREYLTWLFEEMPNTDNLDDEAVLERFMPWSKDVPENCRRSIQEAAALDPLDDPIIDIDPTILDPDSL